VFRLVFSFIVSMLLLYNKT